MDMRNYASKYIKPDQVRDGPIQTRIIRVFEDERYGRPVLELENGSQFTLNESNNTVLMKAFGFDSNDWLDQEVEFVFGTRKDWKTDPPEEKETVLVRAISPAKTTEAQNGSAPTSKPLPPPRRNDLDDEIPFVLAFIIASTATWLAAGGGTLIA